MAVLQCVGTRAVLLLIIPSTFLVLYPRKSTDHPGPRNLHTGYLITKPSTISDILNSLCFLIHVTAPSLWQIFFEYYTFHIYLTCKTKSFNCDAHYLLTHDEAVFSSAGEIHF